ncbi:MAG: single-stranded-DNA-specific exonuclease RecJ [Planctomycetaceae bacterium]
MSSFRVKSVDPAVASLLAGRLGIHPVTAQVLATRGYTTPEAALAFLNPGAAQIHDAALFDDMERAVQSIEAACRAGKRIAVYGDYDVDGVTGTAVLTRALRGLGADVRPFIPHRVEEGYGLNAAALTRLQAEECALVVTVDNGTGRSAEIEEARAGGLEVVVTDHHEPGGTLPDCPVLNPKRADSRYPFRGLSGCGVAFKLACALFQGRHRLEDPAFKAMLPELLALVALGTVADVVPLVDENRSMVSLGLKALSATRSPGLRALLEVADCRGKRVRALDIAFRIGPRINAAGRMGSAHEALDLLLCEDPAEAARLAAKLDAGNRERQRVERRQAEEAFAMAEADLKRSPGPALVLAGRDWHPGVIGIVAARVAETFRLPAALITIAGGNARGSARSHGGIRLHEALERCNAHLLSHGGHAFAAGFTLEPRNVASFKEAFMSAVRAQEPGPSPPLEVDAELPIDAIHAALAGEIDRFQPSGTGNEEPVFCAFGVRAAGRTRLMGQAERHLGFFAAGERVSVRAIGFHMADQLPLLDAPFDLAFTLRPRDGPEGVEILVREILPAACA